MWSTQIIDTLSLSLGVIYENNTLPPMRVCERECESVSMIYVDDNTYTHTCGGIPCVIYDMRRSHIIYTLSLSGYT